MTNLKKIKELYSYFTELSENPNFLLAVLAVILVVRVSASLLSVDISLQEPSSETLPAWFDFAAMIFSLIASALFIFILLLVPCAYMRRYKKKSIRIAGYSVNAVVSKGIQKLAKLATSLVSFNLFLIATWLLIDLEGCFSHMERFFFESTSSALKMFMFCAGSAFEILIASSFFKYSLCSIKDFIISVDRGRPFSECVDALLDERAEDERMLNELAAMPRRFKKLN